MRTIRILSVALLAMAARADQFVFKPIDGIPWGINDSGQVVGYNAAGGFLRDPNGTVQSFTVPSSAGVGPSKVYMAWPFTVGGIGINNLGEVAGNGTDAGGFLRQPDGTIQPFSVPANIEITGINDSRELVGYRFEPSFLSPDACPASVYCGVTGDMNGTFSNFNIGFETFALGINDQGQVVGGAHNSEVAFLRNPDGTSFSYAGGNVSYLAAGFGINDNGQIAGSLICDGLSSLTPGCTDPTSLQSHGFIRQAGGSITFIDYPGAGNTVLTGINDRGEIIGFTYGEGDPKGFLATPVPEPTTLLLLATAAGFALLVTMRRHRPAFTSGNRQQN